MTSGLDQQDVPFAAVRYTPFLTTDTADVYTR